MLKVFLVEDEIVIREGIKNNIDWGRKAFFSWGRPGTGNWPIP